MTNEEKRKEIMEISEDLVRTVNSEKITEKEELSRAWSDLNKLVEMYDDLDDEEMRIHILDDLTIASRVINDKRLKIRNEDKKRRDEYL